MFVSSVGCTTKSNVEREQRKPKPYCDCWSVHGTPVSWKQLSACSCGEDNDVHEWKWEQPAIIGTSWVVVSEDQKQVTFHPYYSSGTAGVRGDTPLHHDYHYYWEVKMLTDTYGTDIMVGLGTDKVNLAESQFKFTSLLGLNEESYGLSYRGSLHHNCTVSRDVTGFCRGTIIGVRVDMWKGTAEFYINREAQGLPFTNLRRHKELYPMATSTAAQSSMRLIYSSSWRASLLVDAVKILSASISRNNTLRIPPGLWHTLKSQFWLTLPTEGCISEDENNTAEVDVVKMASDVLSDVLPNQYVNGFYVDNVDREYRIVVWE